MRKLTIQDWKALNDTDVKIIFLRSKGFTVKELKGLINIGESTALKYSREIVKTLRMKGWNEVEEILGPYLLEWADDVSEFNKWPKGFEDKLRQFEETGETKATPQKKSLPPILVVLILILAAAFFINRIFPANPTPIQTPEVIVETVIVTVEVTPVPETTTAVPTLGPSPTVVETEGPMVVVPSPDTPEPIEVPILTVGDEISDSNVSWKLDQKQFNKDSHALVYWFEFKNKTFDEILLRLSVEDFIMKDNLNREYPCSNLQRVFDVYAHEEFVYSVKDSGEFRLIVRCGRGKVFDADVNETTLYVPAVFSLPASEWIIEVGP